METTQKIKAVAYARVSSKSAESANSLESQQEELAYELGENPELEYLGLYYDYGVSGTKLNRVNFNRMLEDAGLQYEIKPNDEGDERKDKVLYTFHARGDATQPKFSRVYVKDSSRFARNLLVLSILAELDKKGVSVHFMDINKRSDVPSDMVEIHNHFLAAETESRLRSGKVRFGLKASKRKNRIHTSGKLYGYSYDKPTNSLIKNDEEAAVIRSIFDMYASGMGIRLICKHLKENGIKTRQGKDFVTNVIGDILKNEKYASLNNRFKYYTGEFGKKNTYGKVREQYDVVKHDRIPEIVPVELFEECQRLLQSKASYVNLNGVYRGNSEYMGLLVCGTCGNMYHSNIHVDSRRKNFTPKPFYNCSLKKKQGKGACDNPNIDKADIDSYITGLENGNLFIQLEYDREQVVNKLHNLAFMFMRKLATNNTERVLQLQADIEQLKKIRSRLIKLFAMDDSDDVAIELEAAKAELQQMETELSELNTPNIDVISKIRKILENIESIKAIRFIEHDWFKPDGDTFETVSFSRADVMSYLQKIVVQKAASGAGVEFKIDTTKKYQQFIETFGFNLDMVEFVPDDERIFLEQKYNEVAEISHL